MNPTDTPEEAVVKSEPVLSEEAEQLQDSATAAPEPNTPEEMDSDAKKSNNRRFNNYGKKYIKLKKKH